MSKVKKLLAIVLSLAMIMGMSLTTFAAEGTTSTPITDMPSANDKATVTVQGVEADATIKAYQITRATYNQNGIVGFSGYESVELVTTDDPARELTVVNKLQPTATEITSIANAIADGSLTGVTCVDDWSYNSDTENYTAQLAAGYWIIIVENTNTTIYNPMLAGVYYANADGSNNTLEGGKVSADENLVIGSGPVVYAKSTDVPDLTKQIDTTDANKKGNDLAVGDSVSFVLTTTIPDYSDAYKNVVFYITDELSEGLTFNMDSFELNGGDLPAGVTADYVTEDEVVNQQKVKINFTDIYVKEHGNEQVTITYTATLNGSAGVNFDANTNTATLTYTNNPGDTTKGTPVKTYHYTFALDGMLNGQNGVDTIKTSEIIKVDENGNVQNVINTEDKESAIVKGALKGATFQLYQKDGEGNIIQKSIKTASSDESGYFNFSGLDAGTYYLKETAAPQEYQLDTTEHKVVISATYNDNGTLASYTVTIDDARTSTYEATYAGETIEKIDSEVETTVIKNTKLASLPSTGGIGTTIFTISGCVIMIAAAGLYFASRRRQENK